MLPETSKAVAEVHLNLAVTVRVAGRDMTDDELRVTLAEHMAELRTAVAVTVHQAMPPADRAHVADSAGGHELCVDWITRAQVTGVTDVEVIPDGDERADG